MIYRRKVRYVLVESSAPLDFRNRGTEDALARELSKFMGELEYFRANARVAAQLSDTFFIVMLNRGYEQSLTLALTFIKKLGERQAGFRTIRTSGTIRSLRDAYARFEESKNK